MLINGWSKRESPQLAGRAPWEDGGRKCLSLGCRCPRGRGHLERCPSGWDARHVKERADRPERMTIPGLIHWGPSEEAPPERLQGEVWSSRPRSGSSLPRTWVPYQEHTGRQEERYSRPGITGSEKVGDRKA